MYTEIILMLLLLLISVCAYICLIKSPKFRTETEREIDKLFKQNHKLCEKHDAIDLKIIKMEQHVNEEALRLSDSEIEINKIQLKMFPLMNKLQEQYNQNPTEEVCIELLIVKAYEENMFDEGILAHLKKDINIRHRDIGLAQLGLTKLRNKLSLKEYKKKCRALNQRRIKLVEDELDVLNCDFTPPKINKIKPLIDKNENAKRLLAEKNL
jgi:hypothetical protein